MGYILTVVYTDGKSNHKMVDLLDEALVQLSQWILVNGRSRIEMVVITKGD